MAKAGMEMGKHEHEIIARRRKRAREYAKYCAQVGCVNYDPDSYLIYNYDEESCSCRGH